MDSLTQAVLGASISTAILGKTSGRRAVMLGAIVATIPDLDVFIPMGDAVSNFTYHRGFSHSFLFCVFLTPILVWVSSKIKWFRMNANELRSYIAIFLVLVTHVLLDALTIYGTQLFWPMHLPPVGLGSIFIIDPLYTLPFLGFVIAYLVTKSQKMITAGLVISTCYLIWTIGAQYHVTQIALKSMGAQSVSTENILVQSTPFNSILWRVISMNDDRSGYKVGYYSMFDQGQDIAFEEYQSDLGLLTPIRDDFPVKRLQWFTKGFYAVHGHDNGTIIMTDLRMGVEPDAYVFQFVMNVEKTKGYNDNQDENRMVRLMNIWNRMVRDLKK